MANSANSATEFRMLGPIDVVRNGQALPLGGHRQRALLALLLLEPGHPVSSDRLIDELWQGRHPGRLPTAQRYLATFDKAKDLIRETGLARSGEPGSPSRSGTARGLM